MKKLLLLAFALSFSCLGFAAERDTLRVYFDAGEEAISGFQLSLIDIFLSTHYAQGELIVAGHADDKGDPLSNLTTSQLRAKAVAEYLVDKGLPAQNMVVEAWGETKPLFPNVSTTNRARNRRVELIGIPFPTAAEDLRSLTSQELKLGDGTPVAYREMTTPTGNPKQIWVITLDKDIDPYAFGMDWGNRLSGGGCIRLPEDSECKATNKFRLQIATTEAMRCPLSAIDFENNAYDNSKSSLEQATYLKPVKTDSGYYFVVVLDDQRKCFEPKYEIGEGCHTEQVAKIRLDGVKMRGMSGFIEVTNEKVRPKALPDGAIEMRYVNDDPGTLAVHAVFYKSKRRKATLRGLPLSKLPYDEATGEYTLRVKDLRKLNKQKP